MLKYASIIGLFFCSSFTVAAIYAGSAPDYAKATFYLLGALAWANVLISAIKIERHNNHQ